MDVSNDTGIPSKAGTPAVQGLFDTMLLLQLLELFLVCRPSVRTMRQQQREMIRDFLEHLECWEDKVLPLGPVLGMGVTAPALFLARATSAWFVSVSNDLQDFSVAEVVVRKLLGVAERAEDHFVALLWQLICDK